MKLATGVSSVSPEAINRKPDSKSFSVEARSYSLGKMSVTMLYAELILLTLACVLALLSMEIFPGPQSGEWKHVAASTGFVFVSAYFSFVRWGRSSYRPIPCARMDDFFFKILRLVLLCIPAYLVFASTYGSNAKGVVIAIEVLLVLLHLNYILASSAAKTLPPRFVVNGFAFGLLAIILTTGLIGRYFPNFH